MELPHAFEITQQCAKRELPCLNSWQVNHHMVMVRCENHTHLHLPGKLGRNVTIHTNWSFIHLFFSQFKRLRNLMHKEVSQGLSCHRPQ